LIIEDGANLNFKGYSRAFIENIQLSNDINITAEKKSQISIDTEFTLDNNCTILIKDQAVLNLRNIEIIGGHLLSTGGTLNVNGRLNIHSNNIVNSFNGSIFVDSLYIQQFSHLAIQGDLTVNKFLSVSEGCSLSGKIQLYGGVHIKGSKSAPVIISDASIENQSESEFFYYSNINFNSSIIHINFTSSTSIPNANLIFEYCNFNNSKAEIKFKNNVNSTFQFTSCVFNADNSITALEYSRVAINNCEFVGTSGLIDKYSISLNSPAYFEIKNSSLTNYSTGIKISNERQTDGDIIVDNITFQNVDNGIIRAGNELYGGNITIKNSIFNCASSCIFLNKMSNSNIIIQNNIINGSSGIHYLVSAFTEELNNLVINRNEIVAVNFGIFVTNSAQAFISQNQITSSEFGCFFSNIASLNFIDNSIISPALSLYNGIHIVSCQGLLRDNKTTNFNRGIDVGNSDIQLGFNTINNNSLTGIYLSNSAASMSGTYLNLDGDLFYSTLTGYNKIFENGTDGVTDISAAEINIVESCLNMESGYNTIEDNRNITLDPDIHKQLIYGEEVIEMVNAVENYWGDHPLFGTNPSGRFWDDDLQIYFEPYLTSPPDVVQGINSLMFIQNGTQIYDTIKIYPVNSSNISNRALLFAVADGYFYQEDYDNAKTYYLDFLDDYPDDYQNYIQLFKIAKIQNSGTAVFENLGITFENQLGYITNATTSEIVKHLIELCYIAQKDVETAMNEFEEIILSNPGTDRAYYAQIDYLSAGLLLGDSGLAKGTNSKLVTTEDFVNGITKLLKNRNNFKESDLSLIKPKEFKLFQNYPNPFNPSTTIKYHLPKDGFVTLKIFDILGREVKTLVNEQKSAGRYEVNFNAASLASGVYIYCMEADDFNSVKKLLLLK